MLFTTVHVDTVRDPIFFFNDTATTEIYTLSLHDALPISGQFLGRSRQFPPLGECRTTDYAGRTLPPARGLACSRGNPAPQRSEEHTSELQSLAYLVCRLLLEKKKNSDAYSEDWYEDYDNR